MMTTLFRRAALLLALPILTLALPALAHDGIHISDPYARVLVGNGAVYMMIQNHSAHDDVLLSATSPDVAMVDVMTSAADANGVMQMMTLKDGLAIAADDSRSLTGGSDHIMLMGVTRKVTTGDTLTLHLHFEHAGDVTLTVPVDNKRTSEPGPGPTAFDADAGPAASTTSP